MAEAFADRGVELETPDLNRPSFGELTYSGCLTYLDELLSGDAPVRMSGSSFGGYLAARWAQLNPKRVERLVLFCPAFDLVNRWPSLMGESVMRQWERDGWLPIPDRDGKATNVHWELVANARQHPTHPAVPCKTVIVHGQRDEIVPLESSRDYASARDNVELVVLDDVHTLENSIEVVIRVATQHLLD